MRFDLESQKGCSKKCDTIGAWKDRIQDQEEGTEAAVRADLLD
jgi:hypothetical protein